MSLARLVAGLLLSLACAGAAVADLPVVTFEGRAYVELVRVAEALGAGIELSPGTIIAAAERWMKCGTVAAAEAITRPWPRKLRRVYAAGV